MDMTDILCTVHNFSLKKKLTRFQRMDLLPSSGGNWKRETYAGGHFLNGHVEKLQQKPQT